MLSHSQEYAIVGERSFFFKISPLSQRRATSPPVSKYQVQVVINNWVTRINRESYFLVNPISYIGLVKVMYWVTVNVLYCWFSLSTLRARLKPRGWWDFAVRYQVNSWFPHQAERTIIFSVVGFIVTSPHVPFGSGRDAPNAILHRLTPNEEANTFTARG